jgi:hypothetical protein
MLLIEKIVVALLMMFLCTLIHAMFMVAGTHALQWRLTRFGPARGPFDRVVLVWLMTLWMFIMSVTCTIILSIIAHGITANPWARAYGERRRLAGQHE